MEAAAILPNAARRRSINCALATVADTGCGLFATGVTKVIHNLCKRARVPTGIQGALQCKLHHAVIDVFDVVAVGILGGEGGAKQLVEFADTR
jgi:hypothetical protein